MLEELQTQTRQRTPNPERGFSLIEIAMVLVILGILIAIAIPYFGGERGRANDRTAQSRLEVARAHGEEAALFNQGTYPEDLHLNMGTDPEVAFTAGASGGPSEVSVNVITIDDEAAGVYAIRSDSERCWVIVDILRRETRRGEYVGGTCTAATAGDWAEGLTTREWGEGGQVSD